MMEPTKIQGPRGAAPRAVIGALALAFFLPACGGATMSGVAAGKVGRELSAHSHSVPQGAEVCALHEAIESPAPVPGTEKPLGDTCGKALKSDQLWRRALVVLAAYSATLEAMASGASADSAGQLEAAQTGVPGGNWVDVDGGEAAARDAVNQLVSQLGATTSKGDLAKVIKDAAPHVKTLCDGLGGYLEAQGKNLAELEKEAEKKRITRTEHRCGSLDNRSICVGDSAVDRMVYADVFGRAAALEIGHLEARDAVAGFCAAQGKLAEAADAGQLSKDKTYLDIVEAVKAVKRSQPQIGAGAAPAAAPAAPAKK